jgi:hypothetical protein
MADNLKGIPFSTEDEGRDLPNLAKILVHDQAVALGVREDRPAFSESDVYVVWFAYVLGGWKALCSTSVPDGRYYEVTYNKESSLAYVDTYVKTHNREIVISRAKKRTESNGE